MLGYGGKERGGSGGSRWNDPSKTEGARFIAMALEGEQRKRIDSSMVRCGTIHPSAPTSNPRLSAPAVVAAGSEGKGAIVPSPRLEECSKAVTCSSTDG